VYLSFGDEYHLFGYLSSLFMVCSVEVSVGMDGVTEGPAPFAKADRSRFLQALDEALVRLG
jgi:hypothetical protein